MAWNNELPPYVDVPRIDDPNIDAVTTGIDELDQALVMLQGQSKENLKRIVADMNSLGGAFAVLAQAFYRYAQAQNRVTNGLIEFPTQFSTSQEQSSATHTGNIKVSYIQLMTTAIGNGAAIQVPHGYGDGVQGQVPRGWFQMANSYASASARYLDQIVCSRAAAPIVAGYTAADVTGATAVSGNPAATANGWVGNDIRVGDQIKMVGAVAGAGTASNAAAGTTITGAGSAFTTAAKVGWNFRFTAGTDQGWHRIDSITSDTVMDVTPSYVAATAAGTAYEILNLDRTWVNITAVTGGGPPDTLTLESPGTEVTVANGYDYVIRRPMTNTYAWIRFLGAQFTETTLAFY